MEKIYKESLRVRHSKLSHNLRVLWAIFGSFALILIAASEPWSGMFFNWAVENGTPFWVITYIGIPIVMILRGILIAEGIGYFYHRFFEHLGFLTRFFHQIRKNQRNHWIHHMIYYTIGIHYRKTTKYAKSQQGISWEWLVPSALGIAVIFLFQGITYANSVMIVSAILWGMLLGKTHARFHEIGNPWEKNKYFQWLEKIHKLHHWDQNVNYSIVMPLSDFLLGTYMSPKKHMKEINKSFEVHTLYPSDITNWRYLLMFSKNQKDAVFLSSIKKYPDQLNKIEGIIKVLKHRLAEMPSDHEAKSYYERTINFLEETDTDQSRRLLATVNQ